MSIAKELRDLYESKLVHDRFKEVEFEEQGEDGEAILRQMLQEGEIFAYFVIGEDPLVGDHKSRYVSNNVTDQLLRRWFARNATECDRR